MFQNRTFGANDGKDLHLQELFPGYPTALLQFAAGCCVMFMLIGIPGNLITITALYKYKKVRNATAVFIMNLSTSDLMFCCFNLPLAASLFWNKTWIHGPLLCRLLPLMRYGLLAVSLFSILAITINRYVMIGHPRLYPKIYKQKYLALMLAAMWLSGFGALVPTWYGKWGQFGLDIEIGSCSIIPDKSGHSPKQFLFIIAFVIPCIFILVCYARIFYIVRKTALKSRQQPRNNTICTTNSSSVTPHETKQIPDAKNEDSALGTLSTGTVSDRPYVTNEGTSYLNSEISDFEKPPENNNSGTPKITPTNPNLLAPPEQKYGEPKTYQIVEVSETKNNVSSYDLQNGKKRSGSLAFITSAVKFPTSYKSSSRSAGNGQPGKMTAKDKKILKMISVIFLSFVICYLPITVSKAITMESEVFNILSYILIYLTPCINPLIYVVMSSEYRQAYKNLLMCKAYGGDGSGRST